MISRVSGRVIVVQDGVLVVDVGSIGLQIWVAQSIPFAVGQEIALLTHMHWTQDHGPTLYGFEQELDKALFLMIIACSGAGPKMALAVLGHLGAQQFVHAISTQQHTLLAKVPGIGIKKAEQLIVQLKDKVSKLIASGTLTGQTQSLSTLAEVTQALSSLHYTTAEISLVVRHLSELNQGSMSFDHLMRQALSFLAKKL